MINLSPAWSGAIRSLGIVVLMSVLSWASVQANIVPLLGTVGAGIVVMLAAALENSIKSSTGNALFGAVKEV